MCEFQIIPQNKVINGVEVAQLPICEYTNDICTYCVFGNQKTYNEAKRSDNNAV